MVDLHGGDAAFLDRTAQYVGDGLDTAEGAEVVGVTLFVLVGAAVVGMDAHDQAGDLGLADLGCGHGAAFEIAFHWLGPI